MPTSLLEQWPEILRVAGTVEPRRVLDVGAGCGKAAVLFREYVPSLVSIDALDAHAPYIDTLRLGGLYNSCFALPFEEFPPGWFPRYDLVLMVDVIEHIEEGSAVPALRRIARHLLVCTPDVFEQTWEPGMAESERHVSVWTPAMVQDIGFDTVEIVCQYDGWIGLFRRRED